MEHSDVIVIGGGLAGLAAAATAARQGAKVVLLEARSELGGRAATDERDGFLLNLGPHALYLGGAGREVLAGFGIDPPGGFPEAEAWASDGDVVGPLPADARSLVRTPLLGWPAKVAWARLASSLRTLDVGPLAGVTLADWLDAEVRHDSVRRLVELLVRVSSYTNAPELMSAGAAIAQLRLGLRGVRYLDGGWQSMVASLRATALELGAHVERGEVTSVEYDGTVWTAVAGGSSWSAATVVVAAGGPDVATRLLGVEPWFAVAPPTTASSLDLGLRRMPDHPVLFGADRPLYLSTHAPAAALAPAGLVLSIALKYHAPGEALDHREVRAELEEHAARAGVREADVVMRRYLHRSVVTHGLPLAAAGGLSGRPGVSVPDRPGAFVAGDWVGGHGHLADASLSSGRDAGLAAAAALASSGASRAGQRA
jgi:phytoene dehydrogenase-like protein